MAVAVSERFLRQSVRDSQAPTHSRDRFVDGSRAIVAALSSRDQRQDSGFH
jgi:hypothetical protein